MELNKESFEHSLVDVTCSNMYQMLKTMHLKPQEIKENSPEFNQLLWDMVVTGVARLQKLPSYELAIGGSDPEGFMTTYIFHLYSFSQHIQIYQLNKKVKPHKFCHVVAIGYNIHDDLKSLNIELPQFLKDIEGHFIKILSELEVSHG